MKSSWADQDTLMECDQMRFIFQHSSPFSPHTFSIDVAMLESHWLKKKKASKIDMASSYELFSSSLYL